MLTTIGCHWEGTQARGLAWTSELEEQLCYEIKTFLLAGHETSAAMLTWSLAELTHDPDRMAKVRPAGLLGPLLLMKLLIYRLMYIHIAEAVLMYIQMAGVVLMYIRVSVGVLIYILIADTVPVYVEIAVAMLMYIQIADVHSFNPGPTVPAL